MKKTIEVYDIGTDTILNGDISSKIVSIAVMNGGFVRYELMWWNNGSLSYGWFYEDSFSIDYKIQNEL